MATRNAVETLTAADVRILLRPDGTARADVPASEAPRWIDGTIAGAPQAVQDAAATLRAWTYDRLKLKYGYTGT